MSIAASETEVMDFRDSYVNREEKDIILSNLENPNYCILKKHYNKERDLLIKERIGYGKIIIFDHVVLDYSNGKPHTTVVAVMGKIISMVTEEKYKKIFSPKVNQLEWAVDSSGTVTVFTYILTNDETGMCSVHFDIIETSPIGIRSLTFSRDICKGSFLGEITYLVCEVEMDSSSGSFSVGVEAELSYGFFSFDAKVNGHLLMERWDVAVKNEVLGMDTGEVRKEVRDWLEWFQKFFIRMGFTDWLFRKHLLSEIFEYLTGYPLLRKPAERPSFQNGRRLQIHNDYCFI